MALLRSRALLAVGLCFLFLLMTLPMLLAEPPSSASFTRGGSDQLETASVASGGALSFAYDASHGQMTEIADAKGGGFSLGLTADALLHLPLSQTVKDQKSGGTLVSAAIAYDAGGLRASRTVSAGSEGQGSSTTNYWYGGSLNPLVVTRDGVSYRLIGKGVVETVDSSGPSRSYLQADHLGSARVVTDDQGKVVQSIGYVGDYGSTRIEGQSAAASFDSMASFYRFQGQEQEVFPLAKLGIEDDGLAQWLDEIQLYHFPWRDYAAGLAVFAQTDPIPREASLYSAFGANPVNFTDETGGMVGGNDATDDDPVADLLHQLFQNPEIRFGTQDRDALRERLFEVERDVQVLVGQSEAIIGRIAGNMQQMRQTERDLQAAREQQARFHAISLISEHQTHLPRTNIIERDRRIAILLHTAEDLSHRRTSPLERQLSDRYLRFQQLQDALERELQTVSAQMRDLEGWLDIYQVPIERMWDPDESASEAEEDDDDDEFISLFGGSPVSSESSSENENAEDEAPARHHPGNGTDRSPDRSQGDHARDGTPNDES